MGYASFILFQAGQGDLDTAAIALAERGLPVERAMGRYGDTLTVAYSDDPALHITYAQEPYVQEEAEEIGAGTPFADALLLCDARFEILIDDLDAALDEINTLIEVQLTLQHPINGFLFNTWNGQLSGPE